MIKSTNTKFSRSLLLLIFFALFCCLVACGGSKDDGTTTTGTNTVSVSASPSTVAAGETSIISATVYVGGASSGTVYSEGVAVTFTILTNNSGATITPVGSGVSDYLGDIKAIYTAGTNNPTKEVVDIIQASTGKSTSVYQITRTASSASTTGLRMTVTADSTSLAAGNSTIVKATVTDGLGSPASGQAVAFTLLENNSGATLTILGLGVTDASGQAQAIYKAGANSPNLIVQDTIQASITGVTGALIINRLSSSSTATGLIMTLTADETSLSAGESTIIKAMVTDGSGSPASGQTVSFALLTNNSLATLVPLNGGVTDASGMAIANYTAGSNRSTESVQDTIQASVTGTTGAVIITRTSGSGTSTGLRLTLTAAATSLAGGESTIITATVTDGSGAVQGQPVTFSFVTHPSGASLTILSATTDAEGKATVLYTAGSLTAATVQDIVQASITGSTKAVIITKTGTTDGAANPAYMDFLVSSQVLNSSGTPTVTLTAIVKDSSNRALVGQSVDFSATSGLLTINSAKTDASGQATATLSTGGDKSVRDINLTATSGSITKTNSVSVVGTTINISGQDSIGYHSTATYTITLQDSAAVGIASKQVTITSLYNTLDKSTITTDNNGQGTVILTASDSGAHVDTLTAIGIGAIGRKYVTVISSSIEFAFTTPAANTEIPIGVSTPVSIHYLISAAPQVAIPVSFSTSRGTLDFTTRNTDGSGTATVNITSTTVGRTTITASVSGASATLDVAFVATAPASMTLQADPSGITTNIGSSTTQRSTLTAIVRDAQNNLVKNQKINFTLVKDPSGGYLSPATAITDSAGRATVIYIAGTTDSGTNGVQIQAALQDFPSITASKTLTVGAIPLFISIGTGSTINSLDPQTYQKFYDVLVTDAGGYAVSDATVTAKLTPIAYLKGHWIWVPTVVGTSIVQVLTQVQTLTTSHDGSSVADPYIDPALAYINHCSNEDMFYYNDPAHTYYLLNGILDTGEDFNGNGVLDPGTVAAVSPKSITTDSNGLGTFGIIYLKSYATWVYVRVDVTVKAGGTEGKASTTFFLPYAKDEYTYPILPRANPYGDGTDCINSD